ncbi:hypothetical protein CEXT_168041 [Caerostris extrusa]|uniref:Uncharacterized protein n=1 Tax=Caerostris extrusa TaxID=172846 RepID=A0AAV4N0J6_CAEEX|nr:hypothetical protein CEXT_168041 [Caerostris extrusa]
MYLPTFTTHLKHLPLMKNVQPRPLHAFKKHHEKQLYIQPQKKNPIPLPTSRRAKCSLMQGLKYLSAPRGMGRPCPVHYAPFPMAGRKRRGPFIRPSSSFFVCESQILSDTD